MLPLLGGYGRKRVPDLLACRVRIGKLDSDVIHRMLAGVNVDTSLA
jgi:hypothetical protein